MSPALKGIFLTTEPSGKSLWEFFPAKPKGQGFCHSLTTGLVARIWCFYHLNTASVSGWEPKFHSKPSQAKAIHLRSG